MNNHYAKLSAFSGRLLRLCANAVCVITALIFVTGCTGTGADTRSSGKGEAPVTKTAPIPNTGRLIIKFSEAVTDPSQAEFVNTLSKDMGVSLTYLRPMSGGAHVFVAKGALDSNQLQDISQRLSQRSDVIYAEPDRIMRHQ